MTTIDAARYLGVSRALLEHWRQRREGPRFVKFGRSIRYRRADLDEFMARHLVEPVT